MARHTQRFSTKHWQISLILFLLIGSFCSAMQIYWGLWGNKKDSLLLPNAIKIPCVVDSPQRSDFPAAGKSLPNFRQRHKADSIQQSAPQDLKIPK